MGILDSGQRLPFERIFLLCTLLCGVHLQGCASDAVSLAPPNVITMTAEPSIISIGETERIVLYAQSPLPEGIQGSIRILYGEDLEAAGLTIVSWDFTDAFDMSVTVEASETAELGTQTLELPIDNEYERFQIQFTIQVVR